MFLFCFKFLVKQRFSQVTGTDLFQNVIECLSAKFHKTLIEKEELFFFNRKYYEEEMGFLHGCISLFRSYAWINFLRILIFLFQHQVYGRI